jgi:hypothetical protein
MADYDCFPTWLSGSTDVGNVDPRELPISDGLAGSLLRWATSWPASSRPNSRTATASSTSTDEAANWSVTAGRSDVRQDQPSCVRYRSTNLIAGK